MGKASNVLAGSAARKNVDDFGEYLDAHAFASATRTIYVAVVRRFALWLASEQRPTLPEAGALDALAFADTLPETSRAQFRAALEAFWQSIGRDTDARVRTGALATRRAAKLPSSGAPQRALQARHQLDRWMRLRAYSPRTARLYGGSILLVETWLKEHGYPALGSCSHEHVLEYATTMIPNTYASYMRLINSVKAYYRGPLKRKDGLTPVDELRAPPRPEMECKALEPNEMQRFLDAARDEGVTVYAGMCLMYYAALRREETASLEWSRVRDDDWLEVRGKGAKDGVVPVHPELIAALNAQRQVVFRRQPPSRWVFPGRLIGTHISTNTVNVWARVVAAAAGLRHITPHQLRHTAGATMHDTTGDLRATAQFLRHSKSSLSITSGYTRTTARKLREMSDALSFDSEPKRKLRVVTPAVAHDDHQEPASPARPLS